MDVKKLAVIIRKYIVTSCKPVNFMFRLLITEIQET